MILILLLLILIAGIFLIYTLYFIFKIASLSCGYLISLILDISGSINRGRASFSEVFSHLIVILGKVFRLSNILTIITCATIA